MKLIIKKEIFDVSNILLVNKKGSTKLLYKVNGIHILGLPFSIKNFEYIFDYNFLHIKLVD